MTKGRTDLLDSQYFGFNLILLGFFFLTVRREAWWRPS
jgi:hypothetical protein